MLVSRQALRVPLLGAAVALASALAACGGGSADLCHPLPPESSSEYEAQLRTDRETRDAWFRTAEGSPVPAGLRESGWSGLQYFEVDPRLRLAGPLVRRTSGRRFQIVTTAGDLRPCQEIGYFLVDLGAGEEKLPVYELLDQGEGQRDLFVPFMDATTGVDTYPAGRYLEVQPLDRGQFLLDFNLAYNPSCAYGGKFQCPVTPEENRLRASVEAGERGWHRDEC